MKECSMCKKMLDDDKFYQCRNSDDNLFHACKECGGPKSEKVKNLFPYRHKTHYMNYIGGSISPSYKVKIKKINE